MFIFVVVSAFAGAKVVKIRTYANKCSDIIRFAVKITGNAGRYLNSQNRFYTVGICHNQKTRIEIQSISQEGESKKEQADTPSGQ